MSLWPLKIIVKILLSWVPGRHVILRSFGIFRHGEMDDVAYAHKIFKLHAERAFPKGLPKGFTALELGPGDSLLSALIARSYGASKIILSDAGAFASKDIALYHIAAAELREDYGLDVPDISSADNVEKMLEICRAEYLTDGLSGLLRVHDDSIDFIWSHSVLEHVRKADFEPTMRTLARILKKDGVISHIVDLQDHLNYALNNLRFSDRLWECDIIANAGFYTNRIGYKTALDVMKNSGVVVANTQTGQWDSLPTPKAKMAAPFRDFPEDDLCVRTYSVLLKAA